jgi:hypothetical protein
MSFPLIGLNIALGIGIGKEFLFIGVSHIGCPSSIFPKTVCGAVTQYVYNTPGADTITSGTYVATICYAGIIGEG